MFEIIANIHMHTIFSDGSKDHASIAQDAIRSGIDVIFVTDHNIFVDEMECYFRNDKGKVLLIMSEEIHDQNVFPQKNHLLSLGTGKTLAHLANNRQELINEIFSSGGISFLAHPYDPAFPAFNQPNISWEDWSVNGFTGIELWNGFSELKVRAKNKLSAYFYAFFPKFLAFSPPIQTIDIWDKLLNNGGKIVAIGGADAHAIHYSVGFLKKVVLPYTFHFSTINNHILLENNLTGDCQLDKKAILDALRSGNSFIANDMIRPAKGFEFFASSGSYRYTMGEVNNYQKDLNLTINIPGKSDCRIIKNGKLYHKSKSTNQVNIHADSPGIYRVECYKFFHGKKRAWIFSNPIYIE